MPGEREAVTLVQKAIAEGVTTIDTARAYGDSERRIALALQDQSRRSHVITKLPPLPGDMEEADPAQLAHFVEREVAASFEALQRKSLDTLLLHRASMLKTGDGAIWSALLKLQREGRISRLGVSVQDPEEAKLALKTEGVTHIQLATNLLDGRWRQAGLDEALRSRDDLTVHARSVYLQGLLVAGRSDLFPLLSKSQAEDLVAWQRNLTQELGRKSLADLSLAYVRSLDWVDGIVLGMETMTQLEDNLALFRNPPLTEKERHLVEASLPLVPTDLLNPALWPQS